jgi:hypothetical protein
MRTLLTGTTLLIALLGSSPAASAGLEPGAVAPAFEGKEFVNTDEVSLERLRGRVILYEIFRTW